MKYLSNIIGILALILCVLPAIAQPGPGDDPTPVPLDGGISILAAAGVAYGVKKYRDMRKPE